ncbi:MAG: hypothetical protein IPK66_15015 [Rhodospirillales bacterium]|nr:hypothetical protein [Rhodospirillales bacterium]
MPVAFLLASLVAAACTPQEFVQVVGQTLYNSGRYLCTQSRNCDTPNDGMPSGASSNGR